MLCVVMFKLNVLCVFRSENWSTPWWTSTTRPCGMTTAWPSLSTAEWWSLLSCHASGKEVCRLWRQSDKSKEQYHLCLRKNVGRLRPESNLYLPYSLFVSSAFCRQDEIESRLLKIEGLITSLGKHIYTSESQRLIEMAGCEIKVPIFTLFLTHSF